MAEMMHTESGCDAGGTGLESAVEAGRKRPRRDRRKAVDGRTRAARRLAELETAFLSEIPNPSEADRALVSIAATATLQAEQLRTRIVRGEPTTDDPIRLVNAAARALAALSRRSTLRGGKRGARPKTFADRLKEGSL